MDSLHFFKIAKRLNSDYYQELRSKKLYFRGNCDSFSLVSTSQEYPDLGRGNLITPQDGKNALISFKWKKPQILLHEKKLQAWIIDNALDNKNSFCFGENKFTFLTSELIFPASGTNGLRNDILAIDDDNSLAIIELKCKRLNKVKEQAINYANLVVLPNKEFFHGIIELLSMKKWSGSIRKIAVFPRSRGRIRERKFLEVDEVGYEIGENSIRYIYTYEYLALASNILQA